MSLSVYRQRFHFLHQGDYIRLSNDNCETFFYEMAYENFGEGKITEERWKKLILEKMISRIIGKNNINRMEHRDEKFQKAGSERL